LDIATEWMRRRGRGTVYTWGCGRASTVRCKAIGLHDADSRLALGSCATAKEGMAPVGQAAAKHLCSAGGWKWPGKDAWGRRFASTAARTQAITKLASPRKVCFLFFTVCFWGGRTGAKRGRSGAPAAAWAAVWAAGQPRRQAWAAAAVAPPVYPVLSTPYTAGRAPLGAHLCPTPMSGLRQSHTVTTGEDETLCPLFLPSTPCPIQPIWYRCSRTGVVQATRLGRSSAPVWQIYAQRR
jgi:hypothetical protein